MTGQCAGIPISFFRARMVRVLRYDIERPTAVVGSPGESAGALNPIGMPILQFKLIY